MNENHTDNSEGTSRKKKVRTATIYIRMVMMLVFLAIFYSYIHLKAYQIIVFDPIFQGTKSFFIQKVNDIYSSDLVSPGLIAADSVAEKKSSDLMLSAIAISCKNEQNSTKVRVIIDFLYTGKDSYNGHPTNALCIRYSPFIKKIILIDNDVKELIPALRESKYFSSDGINKNIFKEYEIILSHCKLSNVFSDTSLSLPISIVLLVNNLRLPYGCASFLPVLDSDNGKKCKSLSCTTVQNNISNNTFVCRTTNDNSYRNIRDIEPIEAIKQTYYKMNDIRNEIYH